jgi:anthranilate phosphoribosyltransferase
VRTIFNLLGPLTNPAAVKHQVVGVFDGRWCVPVATALGQLGARRAFVVHGQGGLDEVAVSGITQLAEWDVAQSQVHSREIRPRDFGFDDADPAELAGGDAAFNAGIVRDVLASADRTPTRAVRKAAVMEAALALVAVGLAGDLIDGAQQAERAIDDGRALAALERWAAISQSQEPS